MLKPTSAACRRAALAAGIAAALAAASPARAQEPAAAPPPGGVPAAVAEAATAGAPAAAPVAAGEGLLVPSGEFRYNPQGRRDPFKSLLALEQKKKDLSQLPPIQQFDVEAAKVIGVVVDPVKGAQAMIRAPSGQSFVIKKGTVVGKNDGEVVEITLKGVLVVEKYLDFMNRETRKETFLKSQSGTGR